MWRSLISKSILQRPTHKLHCCQELSTSAAKYGAIKLDPADLIDPVVEPIKQSRPVDDEGYFRSLAHQNSNHASHYKDLTLDQIKAKTGLFSSRFVEKANSFAKEIVSNPGHIKFREGKRPSEFIKPQTPGAYANKRVSNNRAMVEVERKYERKYESELIRGDQVFNTLTKIGPSKVFALFASTIRLYYFYNVFKSVFKFRDNLICILDSIICLLDLFLVTIAN